MRVSCRAQAVALNEGRPQMSRSMRVTIIVALNEGNNHPFIAFGSMFKSGSVKEP